MFIAQEVNNVLVGKLRVKYCGCRPVYTNDEIYLGCLSKCEGHQEKTDTEFFKNLPTKSEEYIP